MFSSLTGWVVIAIVVGVILLIGGIALPVIVPFMIEYTQSNQSTIQSGTPFFQFMADWWPLILPAIIIFGVIALVMARGKSAGGMP